MTKEEIRALCLKKKITKKRLTELGYTKVYGLKIPLELLTDQELEEGYRYVGSCADEAAFFDNDRKWHILCDSESAIKREIEKRKAAK